MTVSERRTVRVAMKTILRAAPSLTPRVTKALWRSFYQLSSAGPGARRTAFMNYGYASLDGDGAGEPGRSNDPERFARQLYARVAEAGDLVGKDVLEVGCGRGGGARFIFERFRPRTMTGVDFAPKAIARCRTEHRMRGLTFVTADAEALPFADDSYDVVLNVESSHCYSNVPRFLEEVRRVLRPGGLLLLADFRHTVLPEEAKDAVIPQEDVRRLHEQLAAAGYRTIEEQDITPNIVEALRLDTPMRRSRLERRVPKPLRKHVLAFAAVEGGPMYAAFADRHWTYLRFVLRSTPNGGRPGC